MKHITLTLFILTLCIACESGKKETITKPKKTEEIPFDEELWKEKKVDEYAYRSLMYKEVLYSDSIRKLSKAQVISLLGKPDREENNHAYYLIEQSKIGSWTLNQKSLVIKFRANDSVDWIKLHE